MKAKKQRKTNRPKKLYDGIRVVHFQTLDGDFKVHIPAKWKNDHLAYLKILAQLLKPLQ